MNTMLRLVILACVAAGILVGCASAAQKLGFTTLGAGQNDKGPSQGVASQQQGVLNLTSSVQTYLPWTLLVLLFGERILKGWNDGRRYATMLSLVKQLKDDDAGKQALDHYQKIVEQLIARGPHVQKEYVPLPPGFGAPVFPEGIPDPSCKDPAGSHGCSRKDTGTRTNDR